MRKGTAGFPGIPRVAGPYSGQVSQQPAPGHLSFFTFWVSMIYDYWMHRKDDAFISQFLPAIAGVLTWYERNIDKSKNMLGPMKWWNFVDWVDPFENGVAPGATEANSSILTLQLFIL